MNVMPKRLALVGAELEENLGLRYMTSTLEREEHRIESSRSTQNVLDTSDKHV